MSGYEERCSFLERDGEKTWCNYRPGFGGMIPTEAVITGDINWMELVNTDPSERGVQCSAEGIVAELACYARILGGLEEKE